MTNPQAQKALDAFERIAAQFGLAYGRTWEQCSDLETIRAALSVEGMQNNPVVECGNLSDDFGKCLCDKCTTIDGSHNMPGEDSALKKFDAGYEDTDSDGWFQHFQFHITDVADIREALERADLAPLVEPELNLTKNEMARLSIIMDAYLSADDTPDPLEVRIRQKINDLALQIKEK